MADPCLFCAQSASVALDPFVGPWCCERCLRRLARMALDEPPPTLALAAFWPVAGSLPVEIQRQFREGTMPRPDSREPPLETWNPRDQSRIRSERSDLHWGEFLLYEAAEALLAARSPGGSPRLPPWMDDWIIASAIGTDAHRAYLESANGRPYALLAAARGIGFCAPRPRAALPDQPGDAKLAEALRASLGGILPERPQRDGLSRGFQLLLHPLLADLHLVENVRARWFKG